MADEDREVLMQLVQAQLIEQRRARRWKLFFRFAFLGLLVIFGWAFVSTSNNFYAPQPSSEHAALIKLEGPIFADVGPAGGSSANDVNEALREAFKNDSAQIIILEINTPGGSPVQSAYISDEILRLRKEYPNKPLYAVISDICTSGGMYVAMVADEVYANPASLIGSVGVVFSRFGFVEAIDKLGIERRLMTAGKNKAMLDPFLPESPVQLMHVQKLLDQIHAQFIERVKEGRKGKIKENMELFDGLFWTGEDALDLGLIDGFGDVHHVLGKFSELEEIIEYKAHKLWWENISNNWALAFTSRLFQLFTQPILH